MNEELIKILQEKFLNKDLSVPIPLRNNQGKIIPNKYTDCSGHCTFIGDNKIMNWNLQVTLDDMPIQVNHINDIKIVTIKKFRGRTSL